MQHHVGIPPSVLYANAITRLNIADHKAVDKKKKKKNTEEARAFSASIPDFFTRDDETYTNLFTLCTSRTY